MWGCLQRPKESIRAPGDGVAGSCELADMGAGDSAQGPLAEQQVLFAVGFCLHPRDTCGYNRRDCALCEATFSVLID